MTSMVAGDERGVGAHGGAATGARGEADPDGSPISALVAKLIELPTHPGAALRILWTIDDPKSSATTLSRLIETDPALSARVLRLANSPWYGMSRQVTNVQRALMVLGFDMVRSLAAVAASGLFEEKAGHGVPEGYWAHCVSTATGSAVIARRCGLDSGDAFCAGLLHDLGIGLLHRLAPDSYGALVAASTETPSFRLLLEQAEFEVDHAVAGAAALESWRFPEMMVDALRNHHHLPEPATSTLTRVVRAGEAVAVLAGAPDLGEPTPDPFEALEAVGLDRDCADDLAAQTRDDANIMAEFLAWD